MKPLPACGTAALLCAALCFAPATSRAEPAIVFDAARDCRSVGTSEGLRFVPPCATTPRSLEPTTPALARAIPGLPLRSVLVQRFGCESLRPVLARASIDDASGPSTRLSLAPSALGPTSTVLDELIQPTWRFEAIDGLSGFQAFRPGCVWNVEHFALYPSPSHARLLADHSLSFDGALADLVAAISPDVDDLRVRSAVESARLTLWFLWLSVAEDELSEALLGASLEQLDAAMLALSHDCGGGSEAQLCSRAVADTRDLLAWLIEDNDDVLTVLEAAVSAATDTLAELGPAFAIDASRLSEIRARLAERRRGADLGE